jgi:hypothetical protein
MNLTIPFLYRGEDHDGRQVTVIDQMQVLIHEVFASEAPPRH